MSDLIYAYIRDGVVVDRVVYGEHPDSTPVGIDHLIDVTNDPSSGHIGQKFLDDEFLPMPAVPKVSIEFQRNLKLAELAISMEKELDEAVPAPWKREVDGVSLSDEFTAALSLACTLAQGEQVVVSAPGVLLELNKPVALVLLAGLAKLRGEILSRYAKANSAVRAASTETASNGVEA